MMLDESLDTSIKNKYDNIIKNLDAEINNECPTTTLRIVRNDSRSNSVSCNPTPQ